MSNHSTLRTGVIPIAVSIGELNYCGVQAVIRITKLLAERKMPMPQSIGHRIVHGGPQLREHCRINESALSQLEAAAVFAPLHMPGALLVIRFAQEHFPGIPQVACFDTSFHAQMPLIARVLPIPRALRAQGVQRYGFHGLSCESIVRQLAGNVPSRLIIAHLGNGASVTAVRDGASIDTSMGLTPSGGIIMGSRSGDLDPGVIVYLAREKTLDATRLEEFVDQQSGLLGISGLSGRHASAAKRARFQCRCATSHRYVLLFGGQADSRDERGTGRRRIAGVHRRHWRKRPGSARRDKRTPRIDRPRTRSSA